jgi:glycosyltransferase involved in cell wall biosynthesis
LLGKNGLVDAVARRVFARATAVTTVSDYLLATVVQRMPALAGRTTVVPMPVDAVFTQSAPALRMPQQTQRTIVAVGRLSRQKGFHDLISAAAILAQQGVDFRLRLVGDGEERDALHTLACCLGVQDRVEFSGARIATDLARYFHAADVAVLPSYGEGLGLTLIEAMFCGAPVIGTRSGGICDIITDGKTGLLVPPGDTRALALAMQHVLTDRVYAKRLAHAGQAFVRSHFAPDASVHKTCDLYQLVLRGHA